MSNKTIRTVKLYSYSSELHTFVEAKWALAKFATGGFLIGALILSGVTKLSQSVGNAHWSRSANMLAAENDVLRRELSLNSPRVSELEMQARLLDIRLNRVHTLLLRRKIAGERDWRFTNATREFKLQSVIPAAASFRP